MTVTADGLKHLPWMTMTLNSDYDWWSWPWTLTDDLDYMTLTYLYTVFQLSAVVGVRQFDDLQFVGLFHVFDPLVGLTLGVNHKRPAIRTCHNDCILHRVTDKKYKDNNLK